MKLRKENKRFFVRLDLWAGVRVNVLPTIFLVFEAKCCAVGIEYIM